jgi:hypothetical protein
MPRMLRYPPARAAASCVDGKRLQFRHWTVRTPFFQCRPGPRRSALNGLTIVLVSLLQPFRCAFKLVLFAQD